jgi:hypothetical protein
MIFIKCDRCGVTEEERDAAREWVKVQVSALDEDADIDSTDHLCPECFSQVGRFYVAPIPEDKQAGAVEKSQPEQAGK